MKINTKEGPTMKAMSFPYGHQRSPPGPAMLSEVSGIGMIGIFWNPGGTSFINMTQGSPADITSGNVGIEEAVGKNLQNMISFNNFSELHPTQRFLICCGPLPQLHVAQECASVAIQCCDGKIDELRVPNLGFTALEWAAKKGNTEIVKWLCTDERTKTLVHIGFPIGWAGYTGQVEIMRYLVNQGVDPSKTDPALFGSTEPLFVAAQNGQLDSLKFYVDECKQNIEMKDQHGKDILKHIKSPPNWRDIPGHCASHKWAKDLLQKQKK